jgi:hypothetical protein
MTRALAALLWPVTLLPWFVASILAPPFSTGARLYARANPTQEATAHARERPRLRNSPNQRPQPR